MTRWTEQFKAPALARIKEYEAFLSSCGIAPVAGIEQEFYVAAPSVEKQGSFTRTNLLFSEVNNSIENSPFIERVYPDGSDRNLYEVVIGRGNKANKKVSPWQPIVHTS